MAFGNEFWDQFGVQLRRAFGVMESRGSVSLGDFLTAAMGTYRPFVLTVIASIASLGIVAARAIQAVKARSLAAFQGPEGLYFIWAVAGLMSFALLGIRLPQYFMLVFVPLCVYAGTEVVSFIRAMSAGRGHTAFAFFGILIVIILLNSTTFFSRIALEDDNALWEATEFVSTNYEHSALVLADEPIGVSIPQPYMKLDLWSEGIDRQTPDVIVTYTSLTQKLPDSSELQGLLRDSIPVFSATGFKETIVVYEVP